MFESLKNIFKKSIKKLSKNIEKKPKIEKREFFGKILKKISEVEIEAKDINNFFSEIETELLEANVAVEVIDALKEDLIKELCGKKIKRGQSEKEIKKAFEKAIFDIVNQGQIDIEKILAKKPAIFVFLGYNGCGKTTTIAKIASWLIKRGYKPVLAAGDTFRAASIEQLEYHSKKIGVEIIKQAYGADSAAVIFDAKKHAEAGKADIVLADTAGRTYTNRNLMDELAKVVRVNKPDLKILVVDSLTGNDAVEQARQFNGSIGVDAVILTKTDVNPKGGALLSVCWAIKKPILFLGTGQEYDDLEIFKPEQFVENLLA
jgi:fused signal recognition particle receptor